MTTGDVVAVLVALLIGLPGLYLQWAEVREFKEQNRLTRNEERIPTATHPLRLYWPMIATGLFMVLIWTAVIYNHYTSPNCGQVLAYWGTDATGCKSTIDGSLYRNGEINSTLLWYASRTILQLTFFATLA